MNERTLEDFSFGEWLRQRRHILDLTQQELADRVGCARITLRRIESGGLKPSKELAHLLLEKLDIPERERPGWILFARGLAGFPDGPVPVSPQQEPKTNVPIALTSFVGRENDVERIKRRLAEHRLVTLTGTGGIGKTRLSQEVGRQLLQAYPDGVWFVELASLSDSVLVPQMVAGVFGIRSQSDRPLVEVIIQVLRNRRTLLVLDNCEHLLDACAQICDRLIKNCPSLKILATSREALGIVGEALYPVPALAIPDIENIELLDKLKEYEALRLFDVRAQLVNMDFALTIENIPTIARICARLDGIPLAIELAAARVQTFSPEQIASQLEDCFQLLKSSSPTELPKHRSLQASIDWSWRLLYDAEQTVLRRLSIFTGGFTLEAARQVCTGNGIESRQITGLISQLVAKSLVVADQESGRERRYRLLETIRQYAREQLVKAGEEEYIRAQHLRYYQQLCMQAEPALRGHEQLDWYARLTQEHDNIRAALGWAGKTDLEAGLWISGTLWRFWEDVDLREGESWLEKLLGMPESHSHPEARAKALYAYGIILYLTEQYTRMRGIVEECLSLYQTLGDPRGEIDGLIVTGRYRFATNDIVQAVELARQALVRSEALGDVWRQAFMLGHLGWGSGNDYPQQISYFKEAVSLFRKAGDFRELQEYLGTLGSYELMGGDVESAKEHLAEAMQLSQNPYFKGAMHYLTALGRLESIRGNFEKARALVEKSILNATELGNRNHYLWDRAQLGHIIVQQGNSIEAREIFVETTQEFLKDNSESGVVFSLEGMAGINISRNKPGMAARLIGWADAMREQIHDTRPRLEQAEVDKVIAACISKMGKEKFSELYEEGKRMSLDEAVASALQEN